MRQAVEIDVPTPILNFQLSPDMPLICDGDMAVKLFGIGKTTLETLRNTYSDFPVKQIGRSVRYLVPDLYVWFRDFPDRKIPID